MADFFDKNDDVEEQDLDVQEEGEDKEPEKIKLGEEEYTQDELNELVSLGKIGKEAEEKFDTKIDKVWPDYTKKSQRLKELEEQAKEWEEAKSQRISQKAEAGEDLTPEEQQEQLNRQIDELILKNPGFSKKVSEIYFQQRQGEKLYEEGKKLEGEIDGSDGRPAFKSEEIFTHMAETGIKDAVKAYKDKFETELDRWKEEKIRGAKRQGVMSEGSSNAASSREPIAQKIDKNNLEALVRESLYGKDE
jgi:hypothetical protein